MANKIKWIVFIIAAMGLELLGVTQIGHTGKEYTVAATVESQTELVDERGEVWEYTNIPYASGAEVKITFLDNNTADLTDDVIVEIRED